MDTLQTAIHSVKAEYYSRVVSLLREIPRIPFTEIARLTGAGPATVGRTARKLGIKVSKGRPVGSKNRQAK